MGVRRPSETEPGDDAVRGNKVDDLRRHNLATIIGIVHRDGPSSRSVLTRLTGLNRSTIAALVGELVDLGLVRETDPLAARAAGRPSPMVVASSDVVAFAVNPEIDAITVGAVGFTGEVRERVRVPTEGPPSVDDAVRSAAGEIARMRGALAPGVRVAGVGVAMPGLVRREDGMVRLAPHLGWVDEPFGALLSDATGLPVRTANDAGLGAMAETLFGAGRGVRDLVYLNGGASGIGGGVIVDGHPLRGLGGYAGEFGHTFVHSGGIRCHCGAIGCLETEVRQERLLAILGLPAADADRLDLAIAGSASEALAAEIARQLSFLAIALRNAVNVFNPRLLVLGGFLGSLYEASPDALDAALAEQALPASAALVTVSRARLRATILMVGAAELAFEQLLADPAGMPAGSRG